MIASRVDMDICFSGEVFETTGGCTLDGVQQPDPALLGEAPIICGSARHTAIISRPQAACLALCKNSAHNYISATQKLSGGLGLLGHCARNNVGVWAAAVSVPYFKTGVFQGLCHNRHRPTIRRGYWMLKGLSVLTRKEGHQKRTVIHYACTQRHQCFWQFFGPQVDDGIPGQNACPVVLGVAKLVNPSAVKRQTWMGLAGQGYEIFHRLQALNGVAKFGKLARPAPGSGTDVQDRTGNSICPRVDYRSGWVVSTKL